MKCSRWIAACVDMLDHPVVGMAVPPPKPANPSKHAQQPAMAWLDLIASAAWKERRVPHKGTVIVLQRGDLLAGRSYWATRWNWGEQAVRSFFARLAQNEMIAFSNQSDGHFANVVSICNYDAYQNTKADFQPEKKPEANQSLTSGQPEGNQTLTKDTNIPISEEVKFTAVLEILTPKAKPQPRGARLENDWQLPDDWRQWARTTFPASTAGQVQAEADNFADYWQSKPGTAACKLDWEKTWRTWCRRSLANGPMRPGAFRGQSPKQQNTYRPSVSQLAEALHELEMERAQ